ncbi:acid-sensing ion channel 1C isoform X2 [Electrophorus electricus]|uniref:acid-sensing ion channel 1C isoform X2 n=1 Tax=Electrophorus electricus TaxID=8005 RepID=UPI000F0A8BD9|nr:acid-sensing ion channel 1C isoform X2 [Electrophorus electricus]
MLGTPEEEEQPRPSDITVFGANCTLHGLSHIFLPGGITIRRALWASAFISSLSIFLYHVAGAIMQYYKYPYVTILDEMDSPNMYFPAITLCNYNSFRRSKMQRNDLFWMAGLLGVEQGDFDAFMAALGRPTDNTKFYPSKTFNMLEFVQRASHSIEEMLLDCKYRGKECGPDSFYPIYTRYGKCYTFNSGLDGNPLLTTLKGGTGNGLEIMLDIQQDEYLPVWGDTDETSYEAGIKVQIHSQDEPPFIDQLGFGVAPGFQTFVSCQQQRLQYLPPPWGDCRSAPLETDYFPTYSITACRIECETRYLLETCNCRMVHMPGTSTVCTPEQYKECADPALDYLVEKDSKYCVCLTPCNMTRYGKELSMVKIPSKASAKYLAKKFNKTEQYIGDNILVLDIFFEALNYEKIEQKKAYEVAGLLGDIGGQMGLFIGASVLTILEIFDYLYEVFKDKVLNNYVRKDRSRRSTSDNLEYSENPTSPGVTSNHVPSFQDDDDDLNKFRFEYADKPSNIEHVSTCDTLRSHSDSLGFTPNMLPSHQAIGNFEEFAC